MIPPLKTKRGLPLGMTPSLLSFLRRSLPRGEKPQASQDELARQGSAFADQQTMAAHEYAREGQNGGHET